jgi:hypothetical protein
MDSQQYWPTFDPCPRCGEMTATDGRAVWCLECNWTDTPSLFADSTDQ